MSQYWGSVPLVKKVLSMEEANSVTRAPEEEVIRFVMTELEAAAEGLPETRPTSEQGRIIKSAALAVKGRLLLAEERWDEAASTYEQIMGLGIHSIDPDYKALFDGSKEESSEIILSSKYIDNTVSNTLQRDVRPNLYGGWHFYNPYQNLIDAYLAEDGRRSVNRRCTTLSVPMKTGIQDYTTTFSCRGIRSSLGKHITPIPTQRPAVTKWGAKIP